MKKIIIMMFFCLTYFAVSKKPNATPLAAYLQDSTWHFIDEHGEIFYSSPDIIEVRGFSENFFRVTMRDTDNKSYWVFLKKDGSVAFKPNCVIIYDMHDGVALSVRKNMWAKSLQIFGYYDKNGNEVIKHKYDDVIDFREGLAFVFNKDESGYINNKGKMVIPLKDQAGNSFSEGLAPVNTKEFKVGFIDKEGNLKIDFQFDEALHFSEGKCAVHTNGYFAFIDTSGKMFIPPTYDFAHSYHEHYAFVGMSENRRYTNPKWGFIDTNGYQVAPFKYLQVRNFSEGLAAVETQNGQWGFINYKDSLVIPDTFNNAYSFKNGLAWATNAIEDKYGFINKKGEWVILLDKPKKVFDFRLNKIIK